MYGFENISANNGWAIAFLGAVIVFCGLAVLSLAIAQIYKILNFFEKKSPTAVDTKAPKKPAPAPKPGRSLQRLPEPRELVSIYRPLAEKLKQPFQLSLLYEQAARMELPHTHLSITRLREAGILSGQGEGAFVWDQEQADTLSS